MSTAQTETIAEQARVFGTFGIYRYVLACMVVVCHAKSVEWNYIGAYAVFAFFILSAYIACYMLHYTYLPLKYGVLKFYLNRALRIFPLYWAVFAISLWIIILYPIESRAIHPYQEYPNSFLSWIINLSTIGLVTPLGHMVEHSVILVGWSLGIEIMFWIIMPMLLTRANTRWWITAFTVTYALSMSFFLTTYTDDWFIKIYFSPLGNALPFCIGVAIFLKKQESLQLYKKIGLSAIIAFAAIVCLQPHIFPRPTTYDPNYYMFYPMLLVNTMIVAYLSQVDAAKLNEKIRNLDKNLGNLTYPIYLVHIPLMDVFRVIFPQLERSWLLAFMVIIGSSYIGFLLHYFIQVPIDRFKTGLKRGVRL